MLKAHIVLMKELRAQRDSVADHRFHTCLGLELEFLSSYFIISIF